jgi:hypothetical protein
MEEPMRALFPAMTVLAMTMLAYAPCALAQVVGETGPNVKLFANSKDVLALIDKVKADRKEGQPLISAPIIALAPYRAMLEYRSAKAPAALHETEAEMMYVIEGAGTIVTGRQARRREAQQPGESVRHRHFGRQRAGDHQGRLPRRAAEHAAPDRPHRRRADHPDDAARAAQGGGAVSLAERGQRRAHAPLLY